MEIMLKSDSNQPVYEYIVATFCGIGGYCQFAVAALIDSTYVALHFKDFVPEISFCAGIFKFTSNTTTSVILNKFQSLQIESAYDLTGTHIYSHKPIAVFVGARPNSTSPPISGIVEQLVPTAHWGREVAKGAYSGLEIVKIINKFPWTKVQINSFPEFVIDLKHQTVVRKFIGDEKIMIKANNTIQVWPKRL